MNILNNKITMSGSYRAEIKRNGIIIKETDWFDNIITDYGLERLGLGAPITFCRVGTGNIVPAVNNVVLNAQIASTNNRVNVSNINTGAPNYDSESIWKYTFTHGGVVGNIGEFGLGNTATGNDLFSRCLFTDSNGNPTTLTITAIDQLTVFYKLFVPYPNLNDRTGSITISGVTYNYVDRPAVVGSFLIAGHTNSAGFAYKGFSVVTCYSNGTSLGPITDSPVRAGTVPQVAEYYTSEMLPYVATSKEVVYNHHFAINDGNVFGGIRALRLTCSDTFYRQIMLDKPIPKDNTKTLDISYKFSWGR